MSTRATFDFEGITLSTSSNGFRDSIREGLQEYVDEAITEIKKEKITKKKILEKVELAIRKDSVIDFRTWQISNERKGLYSYILDNTFKVIDE